MYRTRAIRLWHLVWILSLLLVGTMAAGAPGPTGGLQPQDPEALEGAHNCYTFLVESPPMGPRVATRRQGLQISYGAGDNVYVEGDGTGDLEVDVEMRVVRISKPILHPATDASLGYAMSILGTLRLVDVSGDRALGSITASCREIEPGDYLLPLQDVEIAEVGDLPSFDPNWPLVPAEGDATVILGPLESVLYGTEGTPRGGMTPYVAIPTGAVVTIDQGRGSGWSAGDLGLIYWAEGVSAYNIGAAAVPPMIAARGVVLWIEENTANILITDEDGAVELGMKVQRAATGSIH